MPVFVNFDKTLHIVFPSEIKYFDNGSDNIAAAPADNVPNVLRIKAQEEDFAGVTNVSVVCADGLFYSYAVSYIAEPEITAINALKPAPVLNPDDVILPYKLQVSNKRTHLIFPTKVIYIDLGSPSISVEKVTTATNIIKVFIPDSIPVPFPETNLTAITEDNKLYTFNVSYSETPESYNILVGAETEAQKPGNALAIFDNNKLNDTDLKSLGERCIESSRKIYHLGIAQNSMNFTIDNIFIRENLIFFVLSIENKSNISYDIDFTKFMVKDKKRLKKTAVQETELIPVHTHNYKSVIEGKQSNRFVFVFEKFTIPDKKILTGEMYEKNGGRHMKITIENSDIINSKTLN
jgi:conjugative transposon TraN protein